MLNFSKLAEPGVKIALRCFSEEEANEFLREMKDRYPSKCYHWHLPWTRFDPDVGHVDFFPYLNNLDGDNLLWDDEDWAVRHGYKIVDYMELVELEDYGCIEPNFDEIPALFV